MAFLHFSQILFLIVITNFPPVVAIFFSFLAWKAISRLILSVRRKLYYINWFASWELSTRCFFHVNLVFCASLHMLSLHFTIEVWLLLYTFIFCALLLLCIKIGFLWCITYLVYYVHLDIWIISLVGNIHNKDITVRVCLCACVSLSLPLSVCLFGCIYIYICVCVCVCMCVCMCVCVCCTCSDGSSRKRKP